MSLSNMLLPSLKNVKRHTQVHFNTPGKYPAGSCYPTVYACLLGLELHEVPNFHLLYFDTPEEQLGIRMLLGRYDPSGLWEDVREVWLASRGYTEDPILNIEEWLKLHPNVPYIVSGKSARGVDHCQIWVNGELYHDTHEGKVEIVKDFSYSCLVKKVLVEVNP